MKKIMWKYKVMSETQGGSLEDLEKKLNEAGERGYELVGFFETRYNLSRVIIFKKPYGLVE